MSTVSGARAGWWLRAVTMVTDEGVWSVVFKYDTPGDLPPEGQAVPGCAVVWPIRFKQQIRLCHNM